MQLDTTLSRSFASITKSSGLAQLLRHRVLLGGLALALITAGLAWQWSWLVALGVAPLFVSAAPCVAMCALGLCMHRMSRSTGTTPQSTVAENSSPQQET